MHERSIPYRSIPWQVANKLYRSYEGLKPADDKKSVLQVSKLVETGQPGRFQSILLAPCGFGPRWRVLTCLAAADTSALSVTDLQRSFSNPAVVVENLANNQQDINLRVDNALRAGYDFMHHCIMRLKYTWCVAS